MLHKSSLLNDLVEKWREDDDCSVLEYAERLRCADELTAALSPAELGGVEVTTEMAMRLKESLPMGCAGYLTIPNCRAALENALAYTTPRAAEAVTVDQAMIDRAVGVCIRPKGRYSAYHAPETDDEWRAALTAALTPPSAKGE